MQRHGFAGQALIFKRGRIVTEILRGALLNGQIRLPRIFFVFCRMFFTKRFLKNSFLYTLSGALPMASAFLLLPFYLKHLTPSVYGEFSICLACSVFVQTIVVYSFDSSVYIHYHDFKNQPDKLRAFLSSAFIFMCLLGVGVAGVSFFLGDILLHRVFPEYAAQFYPFGLFAVVTGVFQALFKVYINLLQTSEKPAVFVMANLLLFTAITASAIGGLTAFPNTLTGPVLGRMAAYSLGVGWVLYSVALKFGVSFDYALLKTTFSFTRNLYLHQLQQWVINYFDRFLVLFYLSSSDVGVYDFAAKCGLAIELVVNGLSGAFYPQVVSAVMKQEKKRFTVELNRYYYLLTLVVMFAVCGGVFIVPVMSHFVPVKKGYGESFAILPFIAVIYLLRTIRLYFSAPFGLLKISKPLPLIYLPGTLLKIGIIVLFIRPWGVKSVIVGTMAGCLFDILLLRSYWNGKFDFAFNSFKLIISPLLLFGAILIFESMMGGVNQWMLHLGYLALALATALWGYRQEIKILTATK